MRPIDISRAALAAALAGNQPLASDYAAMSAILSSPWAREDGFSGRQSMDCAFNLALAGCGDEMIFSKLCERAEAEVLRSRKGRRRASGLAIAQMAELAAAAGCMHPGLFEAAQGQLVDLGWSSEAGSTAAALAAGNFSLLHPRAARWLHRRHYHHSLSSNQRRVGQSSARSSSVDAMPLRSHFDDPIADLSVDLGCGFGLGALGVASSDASLNVLGCDLNHAAVGFARGVARRWQLERRCAFVVCDASSVLRRLRDGEYDGRVRRIVLSCPTPFAATTTRASPQTLDFFAEDTLFMDIAATLPPGGTLHVAANVEDVAVRLLASALQTKLLEVVSAAPVEPAEVVEPFPFNPSPLAARRTTVTELPRRQALWRDSGGEWAEGPVWQHGAATLLEARSETELASALEQRPTYRFVLERKSSHISTPDT